MMVEVMDRETAYKMVMMVVCGVCYQGDCYLVYSIRRDKTHANVFVSKLIKGSLGYIIVDNFANGEKEVLDGVIKRVLNKESIDILENDGFSIMKDIDMDSNLTFDMEKCYVATVDKKLIKDCLIYYGLVNEMMFNQPVIEVVEDKHKFNEGFVSSFILIGFGIFVLIFAFVVIYGVVFG